MDPTQTIFVIFVWVYWYSVIIRTYRKNDKSGILAGPRVYSHNPVNWIPLYIRNWFQKNWNRSRR